MLWSFHLEGGPQRVNHASVAIGDLIFTFGGYCSDMYNNFLHLDVHCFNTISLTWSKVLYESNHKAPKGCYGHTVVVHKGKIYLWGGQNSFSASNILYRFDPVTSSWTTPTISGALPRAVDGHSACVIGDYMYVFGGFEDETDSFSQSVHRINLSTFVWEYVKTYGKPPSRRDFHTASVIDDHMYIFGGRSSYTADTENEFYSNDVMYLDTQTMHWCAPKCSGSLPSGRRSHSAVVHNGHIFICGGLEGGSGMHLNDVYKFNPVTCVWSLVKLRGFSPIPRRRHCAVVVDERMYLFGGSSPCPTRYTVDNENALREHSDLHILEFAPTLKRLCQLKVIENNCDINYLPLCLQNELLPFLTRCQQLRYVTGRRSYSAFLPSAPKMATFPL